MDNAGSTVLRVFNNNVLLVRTQASEQVIVGRGIGFGRREGDVITLEKATHAYVELTEDRRKFLEAAQEIDSALLETVSAAVDFASDLLGEIHPSVYLLLADHLVFAAKRAGEGETFRDTLTQEISALFPAEYNAAQLLLHFINARVQVQIPQSEAGFIALHLKAARTGAAVRQPLEQANQLDRVMDRTNRLIVKYGFLEKVDNRLVAHIAWLMRHLQTGKYRESVLQAEIEQKINRFSILAREIIACLLDCSVAELPGDVDGEVGFITMFLHGWQQNAHHEQEDSR